MAGRWEDFVEGVVVEEVGVADLTEAVEAELETVPAQEGFGDWGDAPAGNGAW